MVSYEGGHEVRPDPGTCYTVTGLVADLQEPRDYPMEAMCAECSTPIRRESYIGGEWEHFTREGIVIK